jgi:transcriptional regulator with XRE-family HTH domain
MTGVADSLRTAVRTALHDAGISQAEASRRLGLSTKHMSHMLTGRAVLTLDWAEQLLALCGKRLSVKVVTAKETLPMTQPTEPLGTRRTTWASAAELQQAADRLRAVAPQITGPLQGLADPVADWLEETANALAWLAPFREHEPGHRMWQTATKVARTINGTTE